jgi:hypothetical protein
VTPAREPGRVTLDAAPTLAELVAAIEREGRVPFELVVDDTPLWLAWQACDEPGPMLRVLELTRPAVARELRGAVESALDWELRWGLHRGYAATTLRRHCGRTPTATEIASALAARTTTPPAGADETDKGG